MSYYVLSTSLATYTLLTPQIAEDRISLWKVDGEAVVKEVPCSAAVLNLLALWGQGDVVI